MPLFLSTFRSFVPDEQTRGRESYRRVPIFKSYKLEAENEHEAIDKASPMHNYMNDTTDSEWDFFLVERKDVQDAEILPFLGGRYESLYYHSKYLYQLMIVEGTRLLDIADGGKSSSYGALVQNKDTGEMTFACPNGIFFSNRKVMKKKRKNFMGNEFPWHPIAFPYTEDRRINLPFYIDSSFQLSFSISFWGHASYDEQIKWIAKQEGFTE